MAPLVVRCCWLMTTFGNQNGDEESTAQK